MGKAVIRERKESSEVSAHSILHIHSFRVEAKLGGDSLVLLRLVLCFTVLEKAVISDQFRALY